MTSYHPHRVNVSSASCHAQCSVLPQSQQEPIPGYEYGHMHVHIHSQELVLFWTEGVLAITRENHDEGRVLHCRTVSTLMAVESGNARSFPPSIPFIFPQYRPLILHHSMSSLPTTQVRAPPPCARCVAICPF